MGWREDRAQRVLDRRARLNRLDNVARHHRERAEARWRAGYIIPARITQALDLRSLYGPEVDAALGVEEPTVDRWEAGELYPTWEQVVALADLTGLGERWFTDDVPWQHLTSLFICDRSKRSGSPVVVLDPPILRSSRLALSEHYDRLTAETS